MEKENNVLEKDKNVKEEIKPREYQLNIFEAAKVHNTLVVLPTGLGKTLIAVLLIKHRLSVYPKTKALFLAPTKPLAEQHKRTLEALTNFKVALFTGSVSPKKRKGLFEDADVIVATPQTIENDIINGNISLKDVSLVVFDEAHRAVGQYAYVFIAEKYIQEARYPRILALTASPGYEMDKILEVCKNLHIQHVEVRTPYDKDVKKYVQKTNVYWIEVKLTAEFNEIKILFEELENEYIEKFNKLGLVKLSKPLSKKTIITLQQELKRQFPNDPRVFDAMHYVSVLMKLSHMRELLETQGITPLFNYIFDLKSQYFNSKTKALKKLLNDIRFLKAFEKIKELKDKGIEHPKLEKLIELIKSIQKRFSQLNESFKAIIFTQIRDEVEIIKERLNELGIKAEIFIGQGKRRKKGLSQKQQSEIIQKLRDGKINGIISTSVGEEGLDIPEVDFVIFYEPVPSAIRSIQRRGRTGRHKEGNVFVLYTKGTMDENYKWVAIRREKKMYQYLKELKKMLLLKHKELIETHHESLQREVKNSNQKNSSTETKNLNLLYYFNSSKDGNNKNENKATEKEFNDGKVNGELIQSRNEKNNISHIQDLPIIIADQRERNNGLLKELAKRKINLKLEQLPIADYLISSKIAIEFKTGDDFVNSIFDGRIFEQIRALKQAYEKPLLLISNFEDALSRNIHKNALLGALSTILIDYYIPIFFAKDINEAADFIELLANREQNKETNIIVKKPKQSFSRLLKFTIASFPGINYTLAESLLSHFKNLKSLVNADENELAMVEGIGKKRAKTLYEFFNANYESK